MERCKSQSDSQGSAAAGVSTTYLLADFMDFPLAGFEVTTEEKEKLVKESLKGYFNEFHRTMLESHY